MFPRSRLIALMSGASWTPGKLSGLLLWLDAGKITGIANGGMISQWDDLSGKGNHCTQGVDANKPIYAATGARNRPEVAFSYIDLAGTIQRRMAIPAGVSVNENNCTLIYVGRPVSKALMAGYTVPLTVGVLKVGWGPVNGAIVIGGALVEPATPIYHQTHMIGLSSGATGYKYWYNNTSVSYAAAGSAIGTGGMLGCDGGTNYPIYGTLSEVLVYNRGLTDGEMALIYAYFQPKYGLGSPTKQVVFDGDSLTTGYACLNNVNYPGQVWGLLGSNWKIKNVALAGGNLNAMVPAAAATVDTLYDAGLAKNVNVCWAGVIDINAGATPAVAEGRLNTYCTARQAAGWQVVAVTMLPSDYVNEVDRAAFNALVRANWAGYADALADIAADTRIGDAGDNLDATYYNNSDGNHTHMTQAGFAIVASIVNAAIGGLP